MTYSSTCAYNESTCYFIDNGGNCLTDDQVRQMIFKYIIPTYYEWICIILYVIMFLVGTIGNLLVIIVIQRNRSMRFDKNTNDLFVFHPFVFVFFKDSYKYVYNEFSSSWFISACVLSTSDGYTRCNKNMVLWFNSMQIC